MSLCCLSKHSPSTPHSHPSIHMHSLSPAIPLQLAFCCSNISCDTPLPLHSFSHFRSEGKSLHHSTSDGARVVLNQPLPLALRLQMRVIRKVMTPLMMQGDKWLLRHGARIPLHTFPPVTNQNASICKNDLCCVIVFSLCKNH